jgi:hypothetical protein
MVLVAIIAMLALPAFAQLNDVYQVNYFSNNHGATSSPEQYVRIINTGQIGSPIDSLTAHGTICASIYVFDANQEMLECCSCPISANGLLSLRVGRDLTSGPLTGVTPLTGVIKIVADQGAAPAVCSATNIVSPVPGGLRAFGTHVQDASQITETAFQVAPLPTGPGTERDFLGMACSFVMYLGSGKGQCSCPIGG